MEWAAADTFNRMADVEYVGKMEAVVFRFENGKIYGVPLRELEGIDDTPVTRVYLSSCGDAATIEQFSGNLLEVPWDVVLYHACPRAPIAGPTQVRPKTSGFAREGRGRYRG